MKSKIPRAPRKPVDPNKPWQFKRGNKLWNNRSKHGRDKLFATAALMEEAAYEYFAYCDKNPWNKVAFVGKNAKKVLIPTQTPYTMIGLCLYIGCNETYFRQFKADKTKCTQDFSSVISWIEDTVESQLFQGAIVGAFNGNIISRKLGLIDKVQAVNLNYNTDITKEEAKNISDALDEEL